MLTFDSLVKKIKTKHSVTAPWFVTQNVADAALLLWRFNGDDVVPLGVILKTIAHNVHTIEFLSRKKEGGFYRYELQTKYMDRKQSEFALGAGLVSAPSNQIYRLFDKVMQSNQNYKILERESIKEALTAGFFGVMAKEPSHYLPQPECAKKSHESAVVEAEVGGGEDDIGKFLVVDVIFTTARQTQRHEKDRWDVAKKSYKDKGKALDSSQPRRKSQSTPQAPKIGSSFVAEKTRLSRESDNDAWRRKHEREAMNVPTPPPKKH
ncbi:hypothetical protein R1sor_013779 [Riccia sorocarpa]|uniref:Uncharacterized protein n=1 Tax=Riccia sorocarpa TaxID=122646 RepID=A0ABD3HB75_9MARC